MKIGRHKKVQRFLKFYDNYFKFREPYQLLVDGTFCFAARQEQINIKDQLPKYFGAEVKFLTTRCIILETEKIAKKTLAAFAILKQFAVHRCDHAVATTGADCIRSMIGRDNAAHYIVASQDRALQDLLRQVPGVPLVYLHKKSPTLEGPSEASTRASQNKKETCTLTETQHTTLKKLKQISGIPTLENQQKKPKKKKRKGGPNPLSCLKKKKKASAIQKTEDKSSKKKRLRIKVAAHIKNSL